SKASGPGSACAWRYVCGNDRPILDWWDVVQPYTKSNGILMCPSTPGDIVAGSYAGLPGVQNLGIGINVYPTWGLCTSNVSTPFGGYISPGVKLAQVTKPEQTVCLADAGKLWSKAYAVQYRQGGANGLFKHQGVSPWLGRGGADEWGGEWGPEDRHAEICNVGFLDGHVKAMKPQAFYLGWNAIWFRPDRDAVLAGDPNFPR